MKLPNRILAFHLLNDYSGSPKVLGQLLRAWSEQGLEVHLYTSMHQPGFLSGISGLAYHRAWYRFAANRWLRLACYLSSQVLLCFKLAAAIKKTDTIYVNTVLPFAPALLGWLRGCRVIYHVHESTVSPRPLKWFLFGVARLTASEVVNVSNYVANAHGITGRKAHLLYNAIADSFLAEAERRPKPPKRGHVLMACSLKAYKGVFEYVALARAQPAYRFRLVVNAPFAEAAAFLRHEALPDNLEIFGAQSDMHPFYRWADVVLNLSRPDGWVETFGLTIIEGMAYGLPAIVPTVGGITEVIVEGATGYSVDSRDAERLSARLSELLGDEARYQRFSAAAKARVARFREKAFKAQSLAILAGQPETERPENGLFPLNGIFP